jgi:hypothetical protein
MPSMVVLLYLFQYNRSAPNPPRPVRQAMFSDVDKLLWINEVDKVKLNDGSGPLHLYNLVDKPFHTVNNNRKLTHFFIKQQLKFDPPPLLSVFDLLLLFTQGYCSNTSR